MRKSLLTLLIFVFTWNCSNSATIEIAECEPPDIPEWGNYGPRQEYYVAGDIVHYFCDSDTVITGDSVRSCEDSGDWTGDTPICDSPSPFLSVNQTSTEDPEDENDAGKATDSIRNTCIRTKDGSGAYWMGMLATPGTLFRVSVYMPRGNIAYQVIMLKTDGSEYSCGYKFNRVDSMNWQRHDCPESTNNDVAGIKIKSLSDTPLQLCEVVAHTLTTPSCVDPHFPIENGRLQLSRRTATLICNHGFKKSNDKRLECIRNGVWTRKLLFCSQRDWEVGNSANRRKDP